MNNMINVESNTVLYFDKKIGGYIVELIENEYSTLKAFFKIDLCNNIPKFFIKDTNKAVKDLNSFGNSIPKITNSLGIVAESIDAYYTFKDKYEKCKNKDVDGFINPSFKLWLKWELIWLLVMLVQY